MDHTNNNQKHIAHSDQWGSFYKPHLKPQQWIGTFNILWNPVKFLFPHMPCNTSAIVKALHLVVIAVEVSKKSCKSNAIPTQCPEVGQLIWFNQPQDSCFSGAQLRFYGLESFPSHFSHHTVLRLLSSALFSHLFSLPLYSGAAVNIISGWYSQSLGAHVRLRPACLLRDWVPTASSALNIVFFGPIPLKAFPAYSK